MRRLRGSCKRSIVSRSFALSSSTHSPLFSPSLTLSHVACDRHRLRSLTPVTFLASRSFPFPLYFSTSFPLSFLHVTHVVTLMNDLLPLSVCSCVCLCMDVHVIEKQVWVRCRLIPPRASRLQHSSRRRGDSLPLGAQCSVTAEADVARLAVQVAQSRETSACLSERERDCCKSIKRR